MPFAPKIRKQILFALNDHIIPLLQTHTIAQVLATPPFYSSGVEFTSEQKGLLPDKMASPLNMVLQWEKERLDMRRLALLGFNYCGASLGRVGTTRGMARSLKARGTTAPSGITTFRLTSPSAIYVPAHVLHSGQSLSNEGVHRVLLLWFAEREIWINHHDSKAGGVHNLSVPDLELQAMRKDYVQALEQREFRAAQVILLDLMQAISRYLSSHAAIVSNSAWPAIEEASALVSPYVSKRNAQYCYQIMDYIQLHLTTSLSLEVLAKEVGLTVPHLSMLFHKTVGMTLMRYVTLHRLRAAAMMLAHTQETISDITNLTGFASSHSFAGAFKRHFGVSARQYRQKHQVSKE